MNTKQIRLALGLTQKELAERLGCSLQSVKFWETGRRSPKGKYLRKLKLMEQGK